MSGEDQSGLAVASQPPKAAARSRRVDDIAAVSGGSGSSIRRAVDMRELGRRRGRDCPRPRAGLLSISAGDFSGNAAARFSRPIRCSLQPRAERAHEAAGEIGHALSVDGADQRAACRPRAHPSAASMPVALAFRSRGERSQRAHARCRGRQKPTMILPNTCRLSSRASPRSKSASATSVSITGNRPVRHLGEAFADVAHRGAERADDAILLLEQLHQVDGGDGPEVEPQVTSRPPRLRHRSEPLKVSAPTCSNTTSTPFLAVILRTAPSKRSVR